MPISDKGITLFVAIEASQLIDITVMTVIPVTTS